VTNVTFFGTVFCPALKTILKIKSIHTYIYKMGKEIPVLFFHGVFCIDCSGSRGDPLAFYKKSTGLLQM